MTFKDIRFGSRWMTHSQLASCYIRCIRHKNFKDAFAFNSMLWLNDFNTCNQHSKIRNWKYAIRAYNLHKNHKQKYPEESLKIKTKHLP